VRNGEFRHARFFLIPNQTVIGSVTQALIFSDRRGRRIRVMRTIQEFKSMAESLREDLAAKNLTLGHSECLELVARQFGFPYWNTLSSKFDEAGHLPAPPQASADPEGLPAVDAKRIDDRYVLVPRSTSPSVDVVFMINLPRDKRLIAMPCLAGKFGHVSAIEIENLLRVSCVADVPDEGGTSLTKVAISVGKISRM
jgi:hypothetical protein